MKKLLNSSSVSDTPSIRFYDHINPSDLDYVYSFNKSDYLAVNLDDEVNDCIHLPFTQTTNNLNI
jgi:hypothetical protein